MPANRRSETIRSEHVMVKIMPCFVCCSPRHQSRETRPTPFSLKSPPKHSHITFRMKVVVPFLAPAVLAYARLRPDGIDNKASIAQASNESAPTCGVGYTYCGYILQQEKRRQAPFPSSAT